MNQYHDLLEDILKNGEVKEDRTGVGTLSVFGRNLRFDLTAGFPAITTKKLAWKSMVGELLWFIEGSNDDKRLSEITHGPGDYRRTIWTDNSKADYWKSKASFEGDLGRVYGVQWRKWQTPVANTAEIFDHTYSTVQIKQTDQLQKLINGLRSDPQSRRHILSAWNPGELDNMALPPCHILCQFYVNNSNQLSCHMYQRSVDVFLGLPFNIASYALLTHLIAHTLDMGVNELIISTGDTHIYNNHLPQVKELLSRTPLPAPTLYINPEIKNIEKFIINDITLLDYKSHSALPAQMAV
jgi:thymidylate synthase